MQLGKNTMWSKISDFVVFVIQIMATLSSQLVWPCLRLQKLRRSLRETMRSTKLCPSALSPLPTSGTSPTVTSENIGQEDVYHYAFLEFVWGGLDIFLCVTGTPLYPHLSPGNRKRRGTVSGFPRYPTALITWTPCRAQPLSTVADWAATRRGPSHCGEHQEPAL